MTAKFPHPFVGKLVATAAFVAILVVAGDAAAVPPPPVPNWQSESSARLADVSQIVDGAWIGKDPAFSGNTVELRIGSFGNSVGTYLLVGRIAHIKQVPSGEIRVYNLAALTYLNSCAAFAMISIDRLAEPKTSPADCRKTFPVRIHPNGSLSFQYWESPSDRVTVQVNERSWRETRDAPAMRSYRAHTIEFAKSPHAVVWGVAR